MLREVPKVLDTRWRLPTAWREKEWWFGYLHDPEAGIYLSWSCVRTYFMERFRCWVLDMETGEQALLDRPLFFDRGGDGSVLDLSASGKTPLRYGAANDREMNLRVEGPDWDLALLFLPSAAPFTRAEDQFRAWYGLRAHFHNQVVGTVTIGDRVRLIDTKRCYTDHCWGRVPSATGWHWIAAQDEQVAIDSLVNYGPYAQRYTQVFLDGRWHVLPDSVIFDVDRTDPERPWRLVSPDVELEARLLHTHRDHVRVPVLVNLRHDEHVVEVRGRVRIEGAWRDVGPLLGVAEEHHGKW